MALVAPARWGLLEWGLVSAAAVGVGVVVVRRKRGGAPAPEGRACPALQTRGLLGELSYRSWSPASPGRGPIVFFHGRGSDEDVMFERMAGVKLDAAQIYPRGPVTMGSGAAWTQARSTDESFERDLGDVLPQASAVLQRA